MDCLPTQRQSRNRVKTETDLHTLLTYGEISFHSSAMASHSHLCISPLASSAFNRSFFLLLLFLFFFFFFSHHALAEDAASQVLKGINDYRLGVNLSTLASNPGAQCVAKKMLNIYDGTECSNSTGLDTTLGEGPEDPNYLTYLSSCNVKAKSVVKGVVLPNCVPSSASSSVSVAVPYAVSNYTHDVASSGVNSSTYVSAGIASTSDNKWFVLILATNTSDGDYSQDSPTSSSSLLHFSLLLLISTPLLVLFM